MVKKRQAPSKKGKNVSDRFHETDELTSGRLREKREKILQGALRAFLGQGYAVSMDTIATEAGVAKQTIYSYFKDKRSLFSALMDRLLEGFLAAGMTQELLHEDAPSLLRKVAQITLSRMDDWEYVSLLRLVIAESARFPELAELYVSHLVKPGTNNLAQYMRSNERLKVLDPEGTARIIHGALVHFVVVQEILYGKHSMPMPRERLVNGLVDMVLFAADQCRQSR